MGCLHFSGIYESASRREAYSYWLKQSRGAKGTGADRVYVDHHSLAVVKQEGVATQEGMGPEGALPIDHG